MEKTWIESFCSSVFDIQFFKGVFGAERNRREPNGQRGRPQAFLDLSAKRLRDAERTISFCMTGTVMQKKHDFKGKMKQFQLCVGCATLSAET